MSKLVIEVDGTRSQVIDSRTIDSDSWQNKYEKKFRGGWRKRTFFKKGPPCNVVGILSSVSFDFARWGNQIDEKTVFLLKSQKKKDNQLIRPNWKKRVNGERRETPDLLTRFETSTSRPGLPKTNNVDGQVTWRLPTCYFLMLDTTRQTILSCRLMVRIGRDRCGEIEIRIIFKKEMQIKEEGSV